MAGSPAAIAVFADCGATDHAALQERVGAILARKGVHVLCLCQEDAFPNALVHGAKTAGGMVTLFATQDVATAGKGVTVNAYGSAGEARLAIGERAEALIGLPARIAAVSDLYLSWEGAGGALSGKPVGLLNQKKAFEVVKGFVSDVATVGLGSTEKLVQFSDSFEDLLNRIAKVQRAS